MALINPWVLYIGVPVIIILSLLSFKRKDAYLDGKKVANTSLLEETTYFKKLYREYKILTVAVMACVLIAIAMCFVMLSRPAKIDTVTEEIKNRDIFLCMDISDSVDDLNLDMCDELKMVVEELDGERFGISIFNGQSVLLVPLTSDYDYVLRTLDNLKAAFRDSINRSDYDFFSNDFNWDTYHYKYEGTLAEEGSSFIGDGLASALYSFPDLDTNNERSRMIIFTTDNELNGEPYVTVEEAAALYKKNDVKVFAIAPENVADESTFKKAMESTGGEYYKATSSKVYKKLVEDIKKTKTSLTGVEKKETKITDQPQKWFAWMLLCLGVYLVVCKRLKF